MLQDSDNPAREPARIPAVACHMLDARFYGAGAGSSGITAPAFTHCSMVAMSASLNLGALAGIGMGSLAGPLY